MTVKESRGRLSYLTPDRTKPITARKLGDDFDKATVLALLTQNARRAAEQTKAIPEYPAAVKKPLQGEKAAKTTPADNTLQRMAVSYTHLFRLLAVQDDWFSDDLKKLDDENVYRKMQGHWLIEMSEMIATANAKSIEEIKSFLSRQKETYKVP